MPDPKLGPERNRQRFYSGNPVNETIGLDANGDRDNTDRPVKGVDDKTRPILSPVDSHGMAVRNGIPGEHKTLFDLGCTMSTG